MDISWRVPVSMVGKIFSFEAITLKENILPCKHTPLQLCKHNIPVLMATVVLYSLNNSCQLDGKQSDEREITNMTLTAEP
jgi:hypothetical protein